MYQQSSEFKAKTALAYVLTEVALLQCHTLIFSQLIDEVRQFDAKADEDQKSLKRVKDYKKTSLNKGVVIFEEFVRKLEDTWKGKCIKIEASGMHHVILITKSWPIFSINQ